jgi:hypothetical protein
VSPSFHLPAHHVQNELKQANMRKMASEFVVPASCKICAQHPHHAAVDVATRTPVSPPSLARLPAGQPTLIRTTPPPRGLPDVFRLHGLMRAVLRALTPLSVSTFCSSKKKRKGQKKTIAVVSHATNPHRVTVVGRRRYRRADRTHCHPAVPVDIRPLAKSRLHVSKDRESLLSSH